MFGAATLMEWFEPEPLRPFFPDLGGIGPTATQRVRVFGRHRRAAAPPEFPRSGAGDGIYAGAGLGLAASNNANS
jgi:hypothetical protein